MSQESDASGSTSTPDQGNRTPRPQLLSANIGNGCKLQVLYRARLLYPGEASTSIGPYEVRLPMPGGNTLLLSFES